MDCRPTAEMLPCSTRPSKPSPLTSTGSPSQLIDVRFVDLGDRLQVFDAGQANERLAGRDAGADLDRRHRRGDRGTGHVTATPAKGALIVRRSRAAARSPCLAVALVNSISAIWRFSPWPRASVLVVRPAPTPGPAAVASPAGPARRLPSEARCRDPAGFWFRPVCVRYRPGPCAPSRRARPTSWPLSQFARSWTARFAFNSSASAWRTCTSSWAVSRVYRS